MSKIESCKYWFGCFQLNMCTLSGIWSCHIHHEEKVIPILILQLVADV